VRRLVLSSALMVAFTSAAALAQSTVPKTTDQIPPPAVLPTLPMTAPAVVVQSPAAPVAAPAAATPTVPSVVPSPIVPAVKAAAPTPSAKSIPPPAGKATAAPPTADAKAAPAAKTAAKSATAGKACTRLPLSDIQFGRENTIKVAREKLEDYAKKVAQEKGWKGYTRSAETATCEDYLWLPLGGQEYKCLVTATYCSK
jgi:hypothetical protein